MGTTSNHPTLNSDQVRLYKQLLSPVAIQAELDKRARNKISKYYPDAGPLRRELYSKHLSFFRAGGHHAPMITCPEGCTGAPHRERCFLAANRVGKTEGVGAYEMTLHLTGQYPAWWEGKRFNRAISAWAAGDTAKTVREIIQLKLLGPWENLGTGMIPGDLIVHRTLRAGISESIDTVYIRHASGNASMLVFKSYDQRRESFQGSEKDVVWLDEEPPEDIYAECLIRTMTTDGMVMLTFTPLQGLTPVVLAYLPNGVPA